MKTLAAIGAIGLLALFLVGLWHDSHIKHSSLPPGACNSGETVIVLRPYGQPLLFGCVTNEWILK